MSHRKEQIESLMKRQLAQILQRGINDPRVRGLISVTAVDTSPDLKHAKVFVTVLPEKDQVKVIHGLNDARVHLQHALRKAVALRVVPHLNFKLDTSIKKQAGVLSAINEAVSRTETDGAESPTDADGLPETPSPGSTD